MSSRRKNLPVLALVISQAVNVSSLEVSPGSPCATYCLDSPAGNEWNKSASTTNTDDISCRDADYSSSSRGEKFKACISCLQTSGRAHEGEADTSWFAYNLRYTVSTCVFNKPKPPIDSNYEAPCNTDQTCGPLEKSLAGDGLSLNPDDPWAYCGTGDGAFLGSNLQPCISCLRASKDSAYLANFVVALEAGCQQTPSTSVLGLSGNIFTRDAVNITDPNANNNPPPSPGLGTSAIVGIVVGCVLIFALAIALFVVYCTRQRKSALEDELYYGDDTGSPKTLVDPWGYVITQPRHIPGFHDVKGQPTQTNGDFYNRMEDDARSGRIQITHDPRCIIQGPDNAMPAHHAYNPNTYSKKSSPSLSAPRSISPPRSTPNRRAGTPDSFITEVYKSAIKDANRVSKPPAVAQRDSVLPPEPKSAATTSTSTTAHSGWSRRLSSIVIPKVKANRLYVPPTLALQPTSPPADVEERELRISPPLMSDARFIDRPLGAGVVVIDRDARPNPMGSNKFENYNEVPLRSGKSALFGI